MRIRGVRLLHRTYGRVLSRFTQRKLILLYHRVTELPTDPQLLSVSPRHFAEHLEVLSRETNVLPLEGIVSPPRRGGSKRPCISITFDDGYADNFYEARPLLERFDMPATFYVRTGFTEATREFVSDGLARLLLHPGSLPEELSVTVGGEVLEWHLGADARYGEEAFEARRRWNVTEQPPGQRQEFYSTLHRLLRALPDVDRQSALAELQDCAGLDRRASASDRNMAWTELTQLASGPLFEIGSHSVTHPVLARLPVVEQRREIERSKAALEERLVRPVTSFSYPYGGPSDYTHATVALVREAGFETACSNAAGSVSRRSDPLQLPRHLVRDWDGDEFARRLRNLTA